MNNIIRLENLDSNEALTKLDLTVNFVDVRGLPSVQSLQRNYTLNELFAPSGVRSRWQLPHRQPVHVLQRLPPVRHHSPSPAQSTPPPSPAPHPPKKLDGKDVTHSERIAAKQDFAAICAALQIEIEKEVAAKGPLPKAVPEVDDGDVDEEVTGWTPEAR